MVVYVVPPVPRNYPAILEFDVCVDDQRIRTNRFHTRCDLSDFFDDHDKEHLRVVFGRFIGMQLSYFFAVDQTLIDTLPLGSDDGP